eukprot:gene1220-1540_t
MEKYVKESLVGEGTYGVVKKGYIKETGQKVAIKKIRKILPNNVSVNDGVSFSAIREIKMLQELKHKHIVELIDVFAHKRNVYLVFELMEWDLQQVIEDRTIVLKPGDIKSYMKMLLEGIEAVTIWYRAPELLFGAKSYGPSVDMWSIGCIFAELMLRTPYLPGVSEIDQLVKIFSALGTPNESVWPGITSLPNYIKFTDFPATPFKQLFTAASDDALDLLSKMLIFNPSARCTATEALNHPYFKSGTKITPPKDLPKPASKNITVDMPLNKLPNATSTIKVESV